MSPKLKTTLFVFFFFMVCPFLAHGASGGGKPVEPVKIRVFHTGNVAGKVSPCPT